MPIRRTAVTTLSRGSVREFSQRSASSPAPITTITAAHTAAIQYTVSTVRSKSRISCPLSSRAERRAISRLRVAVRPMSANANMPWRTA